MTGVQTCALPIFSQASGLPASREEFQEMLQSMKASLRDELRAEMMAEMDARLSQSRGLPTSDPTPTTQVSNKLICNLKLSNMSLMCQYLCYLFSKIIFDCIINNYRHLTLAAAIERDVPRLEWAVMIRMARRGIARYNYFYKVV